MDPRIKEVIDGTSGGCIVCGDCIETMKSLPEGCVHMCVTSPPYWGLRNYNVDGQIGMEPTPEAFVAKMVEVFREVRRVLADHGTLWLNLGDSYAMNGGDGPGGGNRELLHLEAIQKRNCRSPQNLKPKNLCGIPWRVAFALQADGWYLRQDIIWHKPNPMPESCRDRCTKAHEYLFLLSKRPRYFYDAEAIKENCESGPSDIRKMLEQKDRIGGKHTVLDDPLSKASMHTNIGQKRSVGNPSGRNRRSVWTIPTEPFSAAHFATYPKELIRPCIRAGTSQKGVCPACGAPWRRVVQRSAMVIDRSDRTHSKGQTRTSGTMIEPPTSVTTGWQPLCRCSQTGATSPDDPAFVPHEPVPAIVFDPFGGSGTTGQVAAQEGRAYILIELNGEYAEMARTERLAAVETGVPVKEAKAGQLALFGGPDGP